MMFVGSLYKFAFIHIPYVLVACPLGNSPDFALAQSPAHAGGDQGGACVNAAVIFTVGRDSQARRFGLLGEQSLQFPPPSLRDTSASGGYEITFFPITTQFSMPGHWLLIIREG